MSAWYRRYRGSVLTAIAIAATVGSIIVVTTVSANGRVLHVTTSGTDGGDCTVSACRTLNYAYTQAQPSDTIELGSGSYGNATVNYRAGMGAARVTVRPATSATVSFTDVHVNASYLNFVGPMTFRSLNFGLLNGGQRITDITVDGVNVNAQDVTNLNAMEVATVTNLTVQNSTIGNTMAGTAATDSAKAVEMCRGSNCAVINSVWDHDTFYDSDAPSGSLAHLECFFASTPQGMTIKNSTFRQCTYFDIFLTVQLVNGQAQPTNVLIENNVLSGTQTPTEDNPYPGFAVALHADVVPDNIVLRNNSIESAVDMGNTTSAPGLSLIGNIIGAGVYPGYNNPEGCRAGSLVRYNTMTTNCGTNTTVTTASAIFAGWSGRQAAFRTNDDFHLNGSSPALGKASPTDHPATDFDGLPVNSPPDGGAFKYVAPGADTTPPDTSITGGQPANPTTATGATFTFQGSDNVGVTSYECRMDGGAWTSCTSPKAYTGLSVASHTFDVRAYDGAGNVDASPASYTWTIQSGADTTPPDTTITGQPPASTTQTSATFDFTGSDNVGVTSYECRLDGGSYSTCSSPTTYTSLSVASHTFDVRAKDAAGNTDATPASAAWTVTTQPTNDTANLWIDTSGGSCTRHGTAGTYINAEACASIQAAVAACTAGDTIRMVAGNYGSQSITAVKTSPGCEVIGDPANGGAVVSGITPTGAWFTLTNIVNTGSLGYDTSVANSPHDVTFNNINSNTSWWSGGGTNVTWNGGTIGPYNIDSANYKPSVCLQIQGRSGAVQTNIVLNGLTFVDCTTTSTCVNQGQGCHTETMRIDSYVNGVTLRNSKFIRGGFSSARILIGSTGGSNATNIVLENNYFGPVAQSGSFYQDLNIDSGGGGSAGCNATMRYNTFPANGGSPFGTASCNSSLQWVGNLGKKPTVCPGTYSFNAWIGGTCGGTDHNVASTNTAANGYTLLSPNGFGNPANFPVTDIDGGIRTGTPDAGADQYGVP